MNFKIFFTENIHKNSHDSHEGEPYECPDIFHDPGRSKEYRYKDNHYRVFAAYRYKITYHVIKGPEVSQDREGNIIENKEEWRNFRNDALNDGEIVTRGNYLHMNNPRRDYRIIVDDVDCLDEHDGKEGPIKSIESVPLYSPDKKREPNKVIYSVKYGNNKNEINEIDPHLFNYFRQKMFIDFTQRVKKLDTYSFDGRAKERLVNEYYGKKIFV
jgi:hypothetical protein